MNINRRLIVQFACIAAVPILYVTACGPLLLLAWKCDPQRKTYAGMQHFYRPMLKLAAASHLEQPLSSYLRLWGLYTFKIAGKVGTQQHGILSVYPYRWQVSGKTGTAPVSSQKPPPAPVPEKRSGTEIAR